MEGPRAFLVSASFQLLSLNMILMLKWHIYGLCILFGGFPGSSAGKESTCSAGDLRLISELGSSPREGIDFLLQYSSASLVAQMVKTPPAVQETLVWFLGWEVPLEKGWTSYSSILWFPLVAQMVKNPPAMWETGAWSLGWKDSLEEGLATHSSILTWRIPMAREAWQVTVHGVAKSLTQVSN